MISPDFSPDVAALNAQLLRLEQKLKDKAVKAGLSYAARPVKKAMRANAPVRSGRLKRGVTHNRLSGNKKEQAILLTNHSNELIQPGVDEHAIIVGPNRKVKGISPGYYGHILEYGAKSHSISVRKKRPGKAMRIPIPGSAFTRFQFAKGTVRHPGIKGSGWMGQALDSTQGELQSGFYTGLSRYLEKAQ